MFSSQMGIDLCQMCLRGTHLEIQLLFLKCIKLPSSSLRDVGALPESCNVDRLCVLLAIQCAAKFLEIRAIPPPSCNRSASLLRATGHRPDHNCNIYPLQRYL